VYKILNIYIPAGDEQRIWVKWKTPSTPQKMTATVTASQGYFFDRRDVNLVSHYASSVVAEITIHSNVNDSEPPDPTLDDTAETMQYSAVGVSRARGGIIGIGRRSRTWHVWDCNLVSNNGQYGFQFNKINYTAEIDTSYIRIKPDTQNPTAYTRNNKTFMKSGYGINVEVEPRIRVTIEHERTGVTSTNTYYSPASTSFAATPQYLFAHFHEFSYSGKSRQLEKVNNKFVFKPNRFSTYNNRVHYSPWWLPDGTEYDILVNSEYGYAPTGRLSLYEVSDNSIVVEGTLFDDWAISKSR
jgi:hypothetical protein